VKFRMDFEFSKDRFPEPERFIEELRGQGFLLSLWQYPYLHPGNRLHGEAVERGLVVLASDGLPPVDDAIIDLTNEDAAEWYPRDPGSWLVEDQYLLGTDLLVAPLFEDSSERRVYLSPGRWQRFAEDEGTALDGPGWHMLEVDELPAAVLVRDGTAPRMAGPAQHTGELDWDGARGWRPT
jgi:alpha-glucosidase (family GH31 glycosyl hydrolase)